VWFGVSKLYVVATPIGNLKDVSARALETLKQVDLIAAEDTRHTKRLLAHFGIEQQLVSLHDHNEERQSQLLVQRILAGETVALVSDAGTPLISDPGYRLVRDARAAGLRVEPVPGASALTAALSVSGLPTDQFLFMGFLPVKGRRQKISDVRHYSGTLIFYEAPHRVLSLLEALEEGLNPSRRAVVCRELTKLYEQVEPGSLSELRQRVEAATLPAKGEFVVLVQGADEQPMQGEVSLDDCLRVLMTELSISKAAEMASAILGLKRNVVYKRALAIRDEGSEL
jgi:16S rRNA (cytidine1402-2'-O)-methyltransferase